VAGATPLIFSGAAGQTTSVQIGAGGSVTAVFPFGETGAVVVQTGNYNVSNSGAIVASNNASDGLDLELGVSGSGVVNNYGTISASHYGVGDFSTTATDTMVLNNSGVISAGVAAIDVTGSQVEVTNSGTIAGAVILGLGSSLTDSGAIDGDVTLAGANAGATDVTIDATGVLAGSPGGNALRITAGAYDIVNSGEIAAAQNSAGNSFGDGVVVGGAGELVNRGTIVAAGDGVVNFDGAPSDSAILYNYGSISAGESAVLDVGDHMAFVYNYGELTGGALSFAVEAGSGNVEALVNAGAIDGGVELNAAGSSIDNSGSISAVASGAAAVDFGAGDARFVNTGEVIGDVLFGGTGNVYDGAGGSVTGTIFGAGADGVYYGGADGETFDFSDSGAKLVKGGAGDDTFDFGAQLTAATQVDGGGGYNTLVLDGDYSAGLTFAATTMTDIQDLRLTAGFSYNLTPNDANVAAGQTLTVDGSTLGASDSLTFNATNETNVYFDLIGGAGADTFIFTAANLSANDTVQGGSGAADTLKFATAGTISASALANVSGVETIDLANGTNSITLTNALVASANGASLTINGGTGADTINAGGVTTASDHLRIDGGGGADTLIAGGAVDTFVYAAASDSTGANYDTIWGVNFNSDFFDIPGAPGTIKAIKPEVTKGALSKASFNANLAKAIGPAQLGAHDAVMFKASSGSLAGETFLVVDLNGVAGYQANADLVVRLAGQLGTLKTSDFI